VEGEGKDALPLLDGAGVGTRSVWRCQVAGLRGRRWLWFSVQNIGVVIIILQVAYTHWDPMSIFLPYSSYTAYIHW
jgi:hypothetical protein